MPDCRGHATSFINQVRIMLVNSFMIPGCITNGAGLEAWACAFSCFRACDSIMCSSGVRLLPFLALAISGASLNSGLSMEHVCCHVFLPACVFPSSLGDICHDPYFSLFIFPLLFYHFSYFPHCFSTISLCLASPGHCACFFIPFIPIELTC